MPWGKIPNPMEPPWIYWVAALCGATVLATAYTHIRATDPSQITDPDEIVREIKKQRKDEERKRLYKICKMIDPKFNKDKDCNKYLEQ